MSEGYNVHLRLHEEMIDEDEVEEMFDQIVKEYEGVEYGPKRIEKSYDPAILISGATLVVATLDLLVNVYSVLKDREEVHYINLQSEPRTYIVQARTNAIGRIENPENCEFYQVDGDVTLIKCDDDDVRAIQADLDSDGLVKDLDEK